MPLQFNKFMESLRIFAVAISIGWPIVTVSARPIDKTLIESAILINHEELTNPGSLYASSRFRRAALKAVDVNSTIQGYGEPWQDVPSVTAGLTSTMKGLFAATGNNTNNEIKEGVRLALEYIRDKSDNLGLDIDQIGKATQAIVQAALEASADRDTGTLSPGSLEWNAFDDGLGVLTSDEQELYKDYLQRLDSADANGSTELTELFENSSTAEKDKAVRAFLQIAPEGLAKLLPSVVIETFIPIASRSWKVSAPDLAKSLSEGMARGTITANLSNPPDREKLMGFVSEGTITATMEEMKKATNNLADFGFYPGIDPVDPSTPTSDATMMLGGNPKDPRFHPDKTRILEYAANGLAYGALAAAKDSGSILSANVPTLAEEIGAGAAKAAVEFMADIPLGQDANKNHHLFTYEVVKSIASGASLGSIMVSSSHKAWKIEKLPEQVAERVSYGVASAAIESNLIKQWPNDKKADVALLGEAAAFGSSMGAQFATVFDPVADNYSAWDYEFHGKKASYDRIALAEATSKGSAQGAIAKAADSNGTTSTRPEILKLARGSAMGSVLSNIAMAIYYETDLQSVITASSQGSAYGSLTADNLYKIEKPQGQTEEFEVELARASANGATAGALFEVVSLLDAKPDIRRSDIDSINSAKSATYGSTLGAILGGDKAGQDSVAIKQAVEQGSTEGSLDGVALAMGHDANNVGQANIKSTASIKKAVGIGNTQAALKAASEMATKTIKASASDMLLLMQKYNISPGTTNPGFVFPNPKRKGEEDFLFEEKFPVASPI